jgi:hypothetical protein
VPSEDLVSRYEAALRAHRRTVEEVVPLVTEMALQSIADVLPGAHELQVHGEINEDWIPVLRIRRILDADGRVLYDVEEGAERDVEDMIDEVNVEYLDRLLDLTGDDFMGSQIIDWTMLDAT